MNRLAIDSHFKSRELKELKEFPFNFFLSSFNSASSLNILRVI
jgi:hypothetical protein